MAAVLQLPGDDTSSAVLAPGRGGVFGWNSRGAMLARAISSALITGGGDNRLGEILPLLGRVGGDCLPSSDDINASLVDRGPSEEEGGDSLI